MSSALIPRGLVIALAAALVGCATSGAAGTAHDAGAARAHMAAGPVLVQQVRAAGELGRELDVQPLRDPQVEDLRAAASAAEARGDYAGAQKALAKALETSPRDPELLQWQAELSLASHDWEHARQLATQSWEMGPKLGSLCRRNWTTLRFAAEASGDAAAATQAQQHAAACAVAPPTRY